MANEYYDHATYPSTGAPPSSSAMRAELDSIEAGFDKLPTMTGNGDEVVVVNSAGTALTSVAKDASGAIPGLTLFKLNLMNAAGTIKSWFTTAATAARTWTMPDKDMTVAGTNDKLSAFAATTSAELAGVISDETGSGALVFATSPTLATPTLGVATATSVNKVALTAPATGSTLTIADGKTLTASNTVTITATDGSTLGIGAGGTLGTAAYTGASAYQPADAQLTDVAGLTPTDNAVIIGNGTNFVVESGATLKTSLGLTIGTDVQAYDVDLTTWAGVTPGTGVATALAVNTGSAGSVVVNGGALGTPLSGTVTNLTGTASINTNGAHNGTVGATTPGTGAFTTLSATGQISTSVGASTVSNSNTPILLGAGGSNTVYAGIYFAGNAAYDSYFGRLPESFAGVKDSVGFCTGVTGANTLRVLFTNTGLEVRNLLDISGASAGQIKFPATQNASADANTLDDYEEGTWTPTWSNLAVTNGTGGATHSGTYTKIGRVVEWTVYVAVTGTCVTSSVAGSTTISNLPFTVAAGFTEVLTVVRGDTTAAVGSGYAYQSSVAGYTPAWTTINSNLFISGKYHV